MTLEIMEKDRLHRFGFCPVGFQEPKKRQNFKKVFLAVMFSTAFDASTTAYGDS